MRDKLLAGAGALAAVLFVRNLYVMFMQIGDEVDQGAIYRIIYFHVPAFFTAGMCYIASMLASAYTLWKKDLRADAFAMSATEVGLAFAAVNLLTGMIWGRIIWGIWWAWDPRLTWALISWLVYFGYLGLRKAIDDPSERANISAVVNIFAFTSVAITWKAIVWWRTQHPAPVLSIRGADGKIDPAMEAMIYTNWIPLLLMATIFIAIRLRQERALRELDAMRRWAHST